MQFLLSLVEEKPKKRKLSDEVIYSFALVVMVFILLFAALYFQVIIFF